MSDRLRGINTVRVKLKNGGIRSYHYHRASRTRLPDDPGSPAFRERLERLRTPAISRPRLVPRSFADLVAYYRASPDYVQLAPGTQRIYGVSLRLVERLWGVLPVAGLEVRHVHHLRGQLGKTPAKANLVLAVLRILMSHAVLLGLRSDNPAARPRLLRTRQHRPWEEHELAQFRARWGPGTLERLAFELLVGTGQRGCDVVGLRAEAFHGGEIVLSQDKTGTRLAIPIIAPLRLTLAAHDVAGKRGWLFRGQSGKPMHVRRFRHRLTEAIRMAGLPPSCKPHGLRYTTATVLVEIGCPHDVVAAVTGHKTLDMVRAYSRQRRKARLAIDAWSLALGQEGAEVPPWT